MAHTPLFTLEHGIPCLDGVPIAGWFGYTLNHEDGQKFARLDLNIMVRVSDAKDGDPFKWDPDAVTAPLAADEASGDE